MKKYCFIAAVAVAALCGCSKEALQEENSANDAEYVTLTLSAYPESSVMKSALGDGGLSVEWRKGDAVSVFINGSNYKFTADDDGVSAKFTCNEVKKGDESYIGTIVAAYPYNAGYTVEGNSIKGIEIPAVQNLTGGGFDQKANVSVATGTIGNGLTFKNVCTLVKAHLDAETAVRGVQLTCPSGYALAGKALTVDASTAEITFPSDYAGCTNTVNLINNTEAGISGTDFYMAVAPNEKTGDFKLSVFNAEEKFASKTFKTTKAFTRNKVVTVNSDAPSEASFIHYGTANCICLYGVSKDKTITVDATPYFTSDSYIATGLISYSAKVTLGNAGNMWRETNFKGLSYKNVKADPSVAGKLNLTVKRKPDETEADRYGNMTFPLLSGKDTVWSYHVWSPEDNPDETLHYSGAGDNVYDVMPMALGAINSKYTEGMDLSRLAGNFYQWGRKDSFGRYDVSKKKLIACSGKKIGSVEQKTNTVRYSISHPSTMVNVTNWTEDSSVWGNPVGYNNPEIVSKSIFDPCPDGYMVMPCDVYVNVISAGNVKHTFVGEWTYAAEFAQYSGYMFGDDLISATGRLERTGTFAGSNQAHYWSSTFKSSSSMYPFKFIFDNTEKLFNPKAGSGANSQACCVRCVRTK